MPSRAALPHPLPSSTGRFALQLWERCKRARSSLPCPKALFAYLKVSPNLPSPCCRNCLEGTRAPCYVCVLLFDMFKLSSPSSALIFTFSYASLQGIAITQDQRAVGKANILILKGKSNIFKSSFCCCCVVGFFFLGGGGLLIAPNSPLYELWVRVSLLHITEVRNPLHLPEPVQAAPHTCAG